MRKIEYDIARNQKKILKIDDKYIESKVNPEKEAERNIEKYAKNNSTHIIFGYGAGYTSNLLLQKIQKGLLGKSDIIIIDPIIEKLNIKNEEVKNFIFSGNDKTQIEKTINQALNKTHNRVQIISTNKYEEIFIEEYQDLLNIVKKSMDQYLTNFYTSAVSSLQWHKNMIGNLLNLKNDGNLYDLQKKINIPVVIISGGPSLDKQLPLLKKYEKQVITIVAGSTINSVLQYDIIPDFVVSIDGKLEHYKQHYSKLKNINSRLIYSMETFPKIREIFTEKGFAFFVNESRELTEYVQNNLAISILGLNMGNSCANYAFTIADLITSESIAFIGQDLAFTNNSTHDKSNKDYHELTKEEIERNKYFYVEGYNGEPVLTNNLMNMMKESFEKQLSIMHSSERVYNCTEGGVKIVGMRQKSFYAFLKNNTKNKDVFNKKIFLNSIKIKGNPYSAFQVEKILEEMLKNINDILRIINSINHFETLEEKEYEKTIKNIKGKCKKIPFWKIESIINTFITNEKLTSDNINSDTKKINLQEISLYEKNIKELREYIIQIQKEVKDIEGNI